MITILANVYRPFDEYDMSASVQGKMILSVIDG